MKVSEILENEGFRTLMRTRQFQWWYKDFKKFANQVYGKEVMLTGDELDKLGQAYERNYSPVEALDFVMRNIEPEADDDYDDSMRSAEMGHPERKEAQRWEREKADYENF